MTDGFGPTLSLSAEDDVSGEQTLAQISARRDGADDDGELVLATVEGATPTIAARIRALGLFQILRGLISDGEAANANGVGALGRGLVTGGSLGTAETEVGVGLHGVGSEVGGGVTGYGAIAQGSNSGTPTRSSLRVVPQTNQPSAGQKGDVYISDVGGMQVRDVTAFQRMWSNAFTSVNLTDDVTNTAAKTLFAETHDVAAARLEVGTIIRTRALYFIISNTTASDVALGLDIGAPGASNSRTLTAPTANTTFHFEQHNVITATGVSGSHVLKGSFFDDNAAANTDLFGIQSGTQDLSGGFRVRPFADWVTANAGNTARLIMFIVDVL